MLIFLLVMAIPNTHIPVSSEASNWDSRHKPNNGSSVPSHLFDDHDPATTIKGTGFKNAETAERTIRLSSQPGCSYKQYWTIRAMLERARHHPAQTQGMRDAVAVFERYLRHRPHTASNPTPSREEIEQRRILADSHANAHSRDRCKDDAECIKLAREDRRDCVQRLRDASKRMSGISFPLAGPSFVAVFGGPGEHGYGTHLCDEAHSQGMAAFRCTCAFNSVHTVTVNEDGFEVLNLGNMFPFRNFKLKYDGGSRQCNLLIEKERKKGGGQATLHHFFKQPPSAAPKSQEEVVSNETSLIQQTTDGSMDARGMKRLSEKSLVKGEDRDAALSSKRNRSE
jgi:hypothetical protein